MATTEGAPLAQVACCWYFTTESSSSGCELATIDTAAEIFENDLIRKVPESLRGIARVTALSEAFFHHPVRRVYPGGCFFATVAAQLAPRPRQARDRLMKLQGEWVAEFVGSLRQACDDGEIQSGSDVNQLFFEITAMMFRANFAWIVTDDERVLDQARHGIQGVLSRVARKIPPSGRARKPKKC